jgi:TatD DNase family protein
MFTDTHAHLYLEHFDDDIDIILQNAKDSDIGKIYLPNIDSSTIEPMIQLESKYPLMLRSMIGLHPGSVNGDFQKELMIIEAAIQKHRFAGIGETGTDLYWDKSFLKEQIEAFETQLDWAIKYDIPIIIHARESLDLTIEIVRKKQKGNLKGIFHCFSGSLKQAKEVIDLGFLMGVGGVITYKKNELIEIVAELDSVHFVLETDSPYLPPVPYRGKRNESSYLVYVAQKFAEVKKISVELVKEITSNNAGRIFPF